MGKRPERRQVEIQVRSQREFRIDDPEMVGLYTSSSTSATSRLVDVHAVQYRYSILCLDAENVYFHAEEDEEVYCWPPKEWVKRHHARGGRVGESLVEVEETALRETESCDEVGNEFVVAATDGLGH